MRKNRVLIIDRDLQTCKDIKYNVDSATTEAYYTLTVREGLAELASKEYDLVILNVCFPEMDDMEVLKTLMGFVKSGNLSSDELHELKSLIEQQEKTDADTR